MASRKQIQQTLEETIGTSGKVYFQAPESTKIQYPCIIYDIENINNINADDDVYSQNISYKLLLMTTNPVDKTIKKLSKLKYCRFVRYYTLSGLHHYVYSLTTKDNN